MSDPVALDPAEMFGPDSPCFGCSPSHPIGFHLKFTRVGDSIHTELTPGEKLQGPPGVMHGGLVTTLADEIAAWAVIGLRRRFGFTAEIKAKLHRPVRIGLPVIGVGTLLRESSRVLVAHVLLTQADQKVYEGEFTFIVLDEGGAERLLGAPLPEAWKKYARGGEA